MLVLPIVVDFQVLPFLVLVAVVRKETQHGQGASNNAYATLYNGPKHNLPGVVEVIVP